MELLFKREQTTLGVSRIKFQLWSKIELDDEEQELVNRYQFDDAVLIAVEQPDLLRRSALVGVAAWLLSMGFLFAVAPAMFAVVISMMIGVGAGYWFFNEKRETIFVKDLIHGRDFKCDSVVELAQKEAWLANVMATLRQVMVSAKHWDGTEQFQVDPLPKDEAKALILNL